MKLFSFSLKNATVKWWRSLTLGLLIFFISLAMIMFNSFNQAIQGNVQRAIINGVTGHIQLRSDQSYENDMVAQYNKGWDALTPLPADVVDKLDRIIHSQKGINTQYLIRQSVDIYGQGTRDQTMLLGINPAPSPYRDVFYLESGAYLDSTGTGQILLNQEQANLLGVKVGDTVTIKTKDRYALNTSLELEVVGIGNFLMLSLFSYKACYVDLQSMEKLLRFDKGMVTDIVLYLEKNMNPDTTVKQLNAQLTEAGIESQVFSDAQLTSEDLQVSEMDLDMFDEDAGVILSTYKDMGDVYKSTGDIIMLTLNIFVVFLLIITAILIINLVYMMGIERYRDIGTLRAVGFSRFQVILIFMGEILTITIIFFVLGFVASAAIILTAGQMGIPSPLSAMDFMMGKILYMDMDYIQVLLTMFVVLGFSLLSSFYPAFKACSLKPAQIIRDE